MFELLMFAAGIWALWYVFSGRPEESKTADMESESGMKLPRQQLKVVGVSHYQDAIRSVVGPPRPGGYDRLINARLVCDVGNKFDSNAVRVELDGRHVGFVPKDAASKISATVASIEQSLGQSPEVKARVIGGWSSRNGSLGLYGINLGIGGSEPAGAARPQRSPRSSLHDSDIEDIEIIEPLQPWERDDWDG